MTLDNVTDDNFESAIENVKPPGGLQHIENNLARFMHVLRHLGLRISSAEAVDAVMGLTSVNLLDRSQVKTVFMATLAKSPEDRMILDKAFDSFFLTPEQKNERTTKRKDIVEKEAAELKAAEEELTYQVEGPPGREKAEVSVPLTEEEKKVYSKLPEERKKKLRDYLNKQFQSNPVNNPEQLITSMIKSSLNYWKHYLKNQNDGPPDIEFTGEDDIDEVLQEVVEQLREDEQILYQDIAKLTEKDMPTAAAVIAKLSRKLATRISRRYRYSKKKQRLDLRRTIRHNIRYGGTMFSLRFKTKKVEKPRILLVCDVSGSMARYAGFVLQFMFGLSNAIHEIESFIFSEDVERITGQFTRTQPFDKTMSEIINRSENWGRGTDFNKALDVIIRDYKQLLNKETFIIIVSDTKTLNVDKSAKKLGDIRKKVKDVIWLNTLPKRVWSSTASVSAFNKHVRMFECNTLAHLDRIMRSQMLK